MKEDMTREETAKILHTHLLETGQAVERMPLNSPQVVEGLLYVPTGIAKIYGVNDRGLTINTDLLFTSEWFLLEADSYLSSDQFFLEPLRHSSLQFLPLEGLSLKRESLQVFCYPFTKARLRRIHQQKVRNHDFALEARLQFLLADFMKYYGEKKGEFMHMPAYFRHEDLASMLKTSRQNLTTTLSKLKASGTLRYCRKEFVIPYNNFTALTR
ncbi:Crp/Fnr family transcriptional regulator [Nitritalea halalkaliphila LW7]|uniref:Crp/Fnr family transcriptional regulator n=1 Tax=Nitritalea halalkaliphila LW7 TaxID=1189621 RepID=I5CAM9_9BACT|nr:helix-turn-helix domain-containing protein [Nitritalea halalkaliphila]EIM78881.1 Crp/Fnr family transcriptional regulator [Nitritalea halalkaliphila LW7]